MGGGKGGGGGDVETTVRYAGYIEQFHHDFLGLFHDRRVAAEAANPFANVTPIAIEAGFFGVGFVLSSFPSLYDMYGKFMAGLDVDTLYEQTYGHLMEGSVTQRLVSAEAALLSDDLESEGLPRFEAGMRDMNAVVSSTFVIGRALLEEARLKQVEKYSAGLQYALIPTVTERWKAHLEWNKSVVLTYGEILKLYISATMDTDGHNQEVGAKSALWPFTVLDYERVALAALQGATKSTSSVAGGSSQLQKSISGTMGGAAAGGMIGGMFSGAAAGSSFGVFGAVVGGILGLAASF